MADENRDRSNEMDAEDTEKREEQSGGRRDENGEWIRDQVGEDHNLSGSSTYRTLPDQPEGEQPDQSSGNDVNERQSNR
jgi:hypothetical protein